MATGTILSICQRSLAAVGARANISTLNERSTEAINCNILYTPTFEALARSARWGCLRKQDSLTLIAAAQGTPENPLGTSLPFPPNPWLYSYLLPPDSLFVRQLMLPPPQLQNSGGVPIFPVKNSVGYNSRLNKLIRYETALGMDKLGNPVSVILTNLTQAQCLYTANQHNPAFWDSMLQQAMVASLGAFLVPALSLDKALLGVQIQLAERLIMQARTMDANEEIVSQDREASWISARSGVSGFSGQEFNTGYTNMSWPGA